MNADPKGSIPSALTNQLSGAQFDKYKLIKKIIEDLPENAKKNKVMKTVYDFGQLTGVAPEQYIENLKRRGKYTAIGVGATGLIGGTGYAIASNKTGGRLTLKKGGSTPLNNKNLSRDKEMVSGVANLIKQVRDIKNRKEMGEYAMKDFEKENATYNKEDFKKKS